MAGNKLLLSLAIFCMLIFHPPLALGASRTAIQSEFDNFTCANPTSADITIGNNIFSVSTTKRAAGAIEHLTINGREIVDIEDLGRQIQFATALNGFGECLNPTEAGTRADRAGPTSSKFIEGCRPSNTKLYTKNQPAYWLAPGHIPTVCGTATGAVNTSILSNNYFSKIVDVGFRGMNNTVRILGKLTINEPWDSNYGEGPIYVLKPRFIHLYKFNTKNFTLIPLQYTERTAFTIDPPDIPVVSDGIDYIAFYNPKPEEQGFKYIISNFPGVDTVVSAKYFTTPEKNLGSNNIYWESYLVATDKNYYRRDIYTLLSTVDSHNFQPIGKLDHVNITSGIIRGWAFDPNNMTMNTRIDVYKDKTTKVGSFVADKTKTDVNDLLQISGNHGFDFNLSTLTTLSGSNQLYLYAMDDKNQLKTPLNEEAISYTSPKPGDLNGDGSVNLLDFNLFKSSFNNPYTLHDYNAIIANYGR